MKQHEFVWEPYTTNIMSVLPPICLVGSVAWCTIVPLICFQVIKWHQPDKVLRQFGMQQLISRCPSQPFNIHGITLKGKHDEDWGQLLGPMINQWNNRADFRVDEILQYNGVSQGINTWTVHDLVPYFNILQSSVETQGIARRREAVEAEPYLYPQMVERGHRMYYTPPAFSQYPTQMYQYPFEGGAAETYPNFSWPTMTPSQKHDAPIPTPNAPLGTQ
ncbi:Serine/threonine-protein phosphatase 7 long form [Glycine max]|nr:Serine/threonine-protein phosphatase 7 long form [Glycine max]